MKPFLSSWACVCKCFWRIAKSNARQLGICTTVLGLRSEALHLGMLRALRLSLGLLQCRHCTMLGVASGWCCFRLFSQSDCVCIEHEITRWTKRAGRPRTSRVLQVAAVIVEAYGHRLILELASALTLPSSCCKRFNAKGAG